MEIIEEICKEYAFKDTAVEDWEILDVCTHPLVNDHYPNGFEIYTIKNKKLGKTFWFRTGWHGPIYQEVFQKFGYFLGNDEYYGGPEGVNDHRVAFGDAETGEFFEECDDLMIAHMLKFPSWIHLDEEMENYFELTFSEGKTVEDFQKTFADLGLVFLGDASSRWE
jgi:hypothetical protein